MLPVSLLLLDSSLRRCRRLSAAQLFSWTEVAALNHYIALNSVTYPLKGALLLLLSSKSASICLRKTAVCDKANH